MGLPIAELVIGRGSAIAASCQSWFTFSTWLTVRGATGLPVPLILIATLCTDKMSALNKYRHFFAIEAAFRFAWLIVGALMFWSTCRGVHPVQLRCMMWASLLLGFLSVICAAVRIFDMFFPKKLPPPAAAAAGQV